MQSYEEIFGTRGLVTNQTWAPTIARFTQNFHSKKSDSPSTGNIRRLILWWVGGQLMKLSTNRNFSMSCLNMKMHSCAWWLFRNANWTTLPVSKRSPKHRPSSRSYNLKSTGIIAIGLNFSTVWAPKAFGMRLTTRSVKTSCRPQEYVFLFMHVSTKWLPSQFGWPQGSMGYLFKLIVLMG